MRYVNTDEIDEIYNLYLIEHDKERDFSKVKVLLKVVFDSCSFFESVTCKLKDNRFRLCFKRRLESFVVDFEKEGHNFNKMEEMGVVIFDDRRVRKFGFCIKQIVCAVERLISRKINKDNSYK